MTATAAGNVPTGTVATTVFVVRLITDVLVLLPLATYAREPLGWTATLCGLTPTAIVPVTVLVAVPRIETLPDAALATYTNEPLGAADTESGYPPTGTVATTVSDDADTTDGTPREKISRQGTGGPGPQLGQVPVVEEDGSEQSRGGLEDEDEAAPDRQALLGVAVEAPGLLDREVRRPTEVRALDVDLAPVLGDVEIDDTGKRDLAPRQLDEGVPDRPQRLGGTDKIADVRFEKHANLGQTGPPPKR